MPEPQKYEEEKDLRALDDAIALLSQRFTNIQVFATRHLSDVEGTLRFTRGSGDYFARFGLVKQWTDSQGICIHSDDES